MSARRESTKSYALLAGVGCYFLAYLVLIALPFWLTDQAEPQVVGEDGVTRKVPPYTARQAEGRRVYGEQVCWHCHMQYIRPVNDEGLRWGPVSQAGEYAYDVPHFFGTRRIGPDLHREGLMRVDDWHLAHLWDPRSVVKRSVMPAFPWLFWEHEDSARIRFLISRLDTNGDGIVSPKLGDDMSDPTPEIAKLRAEARLPKYDQWGVEAPRRIADPETGGYRWVEEGERLLTDHDARPLPTQEAQDVVAYLQRLGTTIGPWWRPVNAGAPSRVSPFVSAEGKSLMPPRRPKAMNVHGFLRDDPARVKAADEARVKWQAERDEWAKKYPWLEDRLVRGKELYDTHCASCHGDEGRGNGIGAQHLQIRPRDFAIGKYKWRSTQFARLPLDGDLFRTIVRGLPGTAMPSWRQIPEERIWLLVDYVKTFFEGDAELQFDDVADVIPIPPEYVPPAKGLAKHVARGRAVYFAAACYNCHGPKAEGDGPGWKDTTSDYGALLRPRDLPRRYPDDRVETRLRGGATAQDLYRTIMTGIDGTQMIPQFDTFFTKKPIEIAGQELKRSERPFRIIPNASLPEGDAKRRLPLTFVKKEVDGVLKDVFLDDPELNAVGVKVEDVSGTQREVIYLQEADDWALIHYVMHVAGIPIRTQ